ncbi:MAG: S26 family signal peptidase [Planctomycetota bacterium]|jgi:signal peptidase I
MAQHKPREAAKETLESIVVALILAFVFRAFIVEAFIIPTGSMAPTLYGAHGTILCNDCGTEFGYGLRDLADGRPGSIVRSNDYAYCPNCRTGNTRLATNDIDRNPEAGDRILVLKWSYDIGIPQFGPQRWDVTVFKDPSDGATNFIKRLVGVPNEVLMIVDGDIYTLPLSELSQESLTALDEIRQEKYAIRTGQQSGRLSPTPRFVLEELDRKSRITRKSAKAQDSLWLPAYDHDMKPRNARTSQPYWQPLTPDQTGWQEKGRRFLFEGLTEAEDILELRGPPLRATCAYNISAGGNRPGPIKPNATYPPYVHDQRVRFVLRPETREGGVAIQLRKGQRIFDGLIGFDGQVSIKEKASTKPRPRPVMMSKTIDPLVPGRSIEVSMENLDYRLTLSVDGEVVLQTSDDPSSDRYFGPTLPALRKGITRREARPRIIGHGGKFELSHVAVHRDVYYYLDPGSNSMAGAWPRSGWGSKENPIMLREGEFFMLGDNTAASKDSRLWDNVCDILAPRGDAVQLGTVPRDQLIGRAFFVYWPSMQRVDWFDRMPLLSRWGVVPDVGRMRWIR